MSAVKEGWDALHERIKELEEYGRRWLKNHDIQMQRAIKAEAFIKDIGELPDEWRRTALIKLHSGPTAARDCANDLQAKLREQR